MAAGQADIYIEKYATWAAIITLYQDAANTIPVNLTGYTNPIMQIRDKAGGTVIATPTVVIYDAAAGKIKASLAASQTGAIATTGEVYSATTNNVYDLKITDPSGDPVRVLNGYAKISPGVTQ